MASKDKRQVEKNHSFIQSVAHALNGLRVMLISERNFRTHLISAALVLGCAFLLGASINDYLWLLIAIFMVLVAETVNSLVERIVDLLVGNHYNELAKQAKDIAAGGVLLTALSAALIGMLVLVPLLIKLMPWR
ncbi:diacylglycerol kinase family protein [Nicoliella spurrieriana]|uniref:Diacylglycerol kinase family protein n=1 Tax=Nicoliella spurrieriana TaxID=2925830 RepID=A0A976RRG9_9LACO|nr:diacylglycerol kinase family protein [Nicoliella spurrieriana]UQS86540.1 diacylglycerol kinase family protein [Nicoliella spurrieriana]